MLHPLPLPLSSCLGCIPPLIGLPSLRFLMRLALVCFYCLCVFVYVFYFIATMSFAGYFLSVLFCLLSMLISDPRFDLVWFRLSCDHGWIRSSSLFYCLCVFVYVLYFIATMSFAGYFLSVLFCLLSMLISDSRFDLVWFRLSCDHGWIRSGSVNVRKQQNNNNPFRMGRFSKGPVPNASKR